MALTYGVGWSICTLVDDSSSLATNLLSYLIVHTYFKA
jgi:hypothetical protein